MSQILLSVSWVSDLRSHVKQVPRILGLEPLFWVPGVGCLVSGPTYEFGSGSRVSGPTVKVWSLRSRVASTRWVPSLGSRVPPKVPGLGSHFSDMPSKKENNFFYALFKCMYRSWIFHSYYTYQLNSQSMGRPDKRKAARDILLSTVLNSSLSKKRINLLGEQWVHSKNYNYLKPTQLLDLCFSVLPFGLWIYCG